MSVCEAHTPLAGPAEAILSWSGRTRMRKQFYEL